MPSAGNAGEQVDQGEGSNCSQSWSVSKKVKNVHEKEQVHIVCQYCEQRSVVLGNQVEYASGHFSTVRTLMMIDGQQP